MLYAGPSLEFINYKYITGLKSAQCTLKCAAMVSRGIPRIRRGEPRNLANGAAKFAAENCGPCIFVVNLWVHCSVWECFRWQLEWECRLCLQNGWRSAGSIAMILLSWQLMNIWWYAVLIFHCSLYTQEHGVPWSLEVVGWSWMAATCLENLEMSENLTDVAKISEK